MYHKLTVYVKGRYQTNLFPSCCFGDKYHKYHSNSINTHLISFIFLHPMHNSMFQRCTTRIYGRGGCKNSQADHHWQHWISRSSIYTDMFQRVMQQYHHHSQLVTTSVSKIRWAYIRILQCLAFLNKNQAVSLSGFLI